MPGRPHMKLGGYVWASEGGAQPARRTSSQCLMSICWGHCRDNVRVHDPPLQIDTARRFRLILYDHIVAIENLMSA